MHANDRRTKQFDVIYDLLQKDPQGISLTTLEKDLKERFSFSLTRRTLLRCLTELKKNKKNRYAGGWKSFLLPTSSKKSSMC